MTVRLGLIYYHTSVSSLSCFSDFSNVCHSICFWSTALKLGCVINLDFHFLFLLDKIEFMLTSSHYYYTIFASRLNFVRNAVTGFQRNTARTLTGFVRKAKEVPLAQVTLLSQSVVPALANTRLITLKVTGAKRVTFTRHATTGSEIIAVYLLGTKKVKVHFF